MCPRCWSPNPKNLCGCVYCGFPFNYEYQVNKKYLEMLRIFNCREGAD